MVPSCSTNFCWAFATSELPKWLEPTCSRAPSVAACQLMVAVRPSVVVRSASSNGRGLRSDRTMISRGERCSRTRRPSCGPHGTSVMTENSAMYGTRQRDTTPKSIREPDPAWQVKSLSGTMTSDWSTSCHGSCRRVSGSSLKSDSHMKGREPFLVMVATASIWDLQSPSLA